MIPWQQLDRTKIPGSSDELRLMQRGTEFSIMLGRIELMNSRRSGSEEALATLAIEKIGKRPKPHLLIGGLGMGFTLRAALAQLGPDAKLTVVELVPEIVAWARGPLAHLFNGCLEDPRVVIQESDVSCVIRTQPATYDAILLDVDNGPEGLTHTANDRLYDLEGLNAAKKALRPGGVLTVWSVGQDRSFTTRLHKTGFKVDERTVRSHGKSGPRHVIWVAT